MKNKSKRYKELLKTSVKDKKISSKEILDLVKKNSTTKFDESIDVSLRINLKQSKGGDLSLRTVVKLPNGSGKKIKIAVLCEPDKVDEAKKVVKEDAGVDNKIVNQDGEGDSKQEPKVVSEGFDIVAMTLKSMQRV